jgi:homogentisate phytyltransferase / homogentisate geranylgeranyltransferase
MTQISGSRPVNFWKNPTSWLYSFWKFSRPHTIIGTSLSVFSLYLIAIAFSDSAIANLGQLLGAWLACLCGNLYIVGLNQLEDVAIDEINKPHLPLAAGEFSQQQGQGIVGITGILALLVAGLLGGWLFVVVSASLALGTAYSLPPLRLKRFPFWAAFCILSVRGAIINLGLFLHFNVTLGGKAVFPAAVVALTLFILGFSVAIAIFKDVPDTEGDKQYNIATLTLLLGKPAIFNLARGIIAVCYLGLIVAAILKLPGVNPTFLGMSHFILLGLLGWRSQKVDLDDKSAIAQFYQFIWKLFFLEYLLFPLACLLT